MSARFPIALMLSIVWLDDCLEPMIQDEADTNISTARSARVHMGGELCDIRHV